MDRSGGKAARFLKRFFILLPPSPQSTLTSDDNEHSQQRGGEKMKTRKMRSFSFWTSKLINEQLKQNASLIWGLFVASRELRATSFMSDGMGRNRAVMSLWWSTRLSRAWVIWGRNKNTQNSATYIESLFIVAKRAGVFDNWKMFHFSGWTIAGKSHTDESLEQLIK